MPDPLNSGQISAGLYWVDVCSAPATASSVSSRYAAVLGNVNLFLPVSLGWLVVDESELVHSASSGI